MAPKSFTLILLLLLLLSAAVAAHSDRLEPEVAAGCWKEIYQVPNCVFHIIKAFITHRAAADEVGVPCCKAYLSLTGDCQVEIFQNSDITPVVESFCAALVGGSADSPVASPAAGCSCCP